VKVEGKEGSPLFFSADLRSWWWL